MSSRFILTWPQMPNFTESLMWQNHPRWTILLNTLRVKETDAKPNREMNFLMNPVNPGNQVGIKGSYEAFYDVRSSFFVCEACGFCFITYCNLVLKMHSGGLHNWMKAIDSNDWNVSVAISKIFLISISHSPNRRYDYRMRMSQLSLLTAWPLHFYKVSLINNIAGCETKLPIINDRDKYFWWLLYHLDQK